MSVVRQLPKLTNLDEAELRAFYASCGMSAETIESAIKARRIPPADDSSTPRGKRREQPKARA